MAKDNISEGEVVEHSLATVPAAPLSKAVMLTPNQLRKQMQRDIEMRKIVDEYIAANMVAGKDYGSIEVKKGSGIMSKPSLLKPGSEKFCSLFKIRATFRRDEETVAMLGNTPGIIGYVCELVNSAGVVVGEGRGTAKADPNGQDFDINKQVKIAQKRAQIDAVLRTGGLSDFFTQDMEDLPKGEGGEAPARPASQKQKDFVVSLMQQCGFAPRQMAMVAAANGVPDAKNMTSDQASDLIGKLKDGSYVTPDFEMEAARGDGDAMASLAEDRGRAETGQELPEPEPTNPNDVPF